MEDRYKQLSQELQFKKMKSNMIVAIFMIGSMVLMNKYYSGTVLAKLPFQPVWLISSMSHRGIEGNDLTDCSYVFIFILIGMVFRNNV